MHRSSRYGCGASVIYMLTPFTINQYKNSKENLFSKRTKVDKFKAVTEDKRYVALALFFLIGITSNKAW
jgi:hypothetical protein